ncbi:MAG: hypothetical protein D6698_15470 [Gammaproteobacteria bacterium]|nr:MAG: hypothetical protein D6698_15470 [Gammaproteobacteria bacterium]
MLEAVDQQHDLIRHELIKALAIKLLCNVLGKLLMSPLQAEEAPTQGLLIAIALPLIRGS